MGHLKGTLLYPLLFSLLFLVFWIRGITFLDPDFGWHLRMGQHILTYGIPATDPLSYTMPSFPFIDHEWLTNVLIALAYPHIGMGGLALVSTSLILLTLAISVHKLWEKWSLIPLLLSAASLLPFSGVRPQVITWAFFTIFTSILLNKKKYQTQWIILPILMVLWVNLHGGFASGIAAVLVSVFAKTYQEKKVELKSIILVFFSILTTFLNPYGPRVWTEVWLQMSDQRLRWSINEWLPSFYHNDLSLWVLVSLSLFMVIRYRTKFHFSEHAVYAGIFLASVSSVRHTPLWIFTNSSYLARSIEYFWKEVSRNKIASKRFHQVARGLTYAALLILIGGSVAALQEARKLSEEQFYPARAIEFLRNHPTQGEIFANYGWGGYLNWKLPEKRVFIDGRMPSWRWKFGSGKESDYAFLEYTDLTNGELSLEYVVQKYHIDTLLLSTEKKKEHKGFLSQVRNIVRTFLGLEQESKHKNTLPDQAKKIGMYHVYKDPIATVYRKKK